MKSATKPIRHYPYHLRHVATLLHYLGKLKIQIFFIYLANMKDSANKWYFKKLSTFEIRLSTSLMCTHSNTKFTNVLSKSFVAEYDVDY